MKRASVMTLALVAWALVAAVEAAPQAERRDLPAVDELLQSQVFSLLTNMPADGKLDRVVLLDDLSALGAPLVPIAVGILCGEIAVPENVWGSEDQPCDPRLVELRDGVLREALGRLDKGVVVDHLARRAGPDAPLEVRLCAARLLGESGHPRAVDVLLQVAAGIEPIHLARAYVLQAFEEPLARALAADPRADTALSGRVARLSDPVRDLLLRAAVQADSAVTRRFLAARLTAGEAEQAIVLGAIAASRPGTFEADAEQRGALRARLRSLEEGLPRLAALALGKLEDRAAVSDLIELLESEDPLAVAAALEALRWIGGSDLGNRPAAWRGWWAAEERWWSEAAPAKLSDLQSGERLAVHRALGELLRHPLYRHELAPDVARLLLEEDELLAVAGCDALAALGSKEALPALIEARAFAAGPVRDAVERALQALARRDPNLRDYLAIR